MTKFFRSAVCCSAFMALVWCVPSPVVAAERMVTLGTAGVTGVYYPAGGAICRLVNRTRREHGLRCVVESTGGSISNLEDLRANEMDLGIVQSDWLYSAYHGTEVFNDVGEDASLRALFALHSEPFTIVVNKDSNIKSFDDLKGKRVYVGNRGSGMRATMGELAKLEGWSDNAFTTVMDIEYENVAQSLCQGQIDAVIYAVGHPNGAIQQVTSVCETRLIGVSGKVVDQLIEKHPFYNYAMIPGGMYLNNPYSVKTFGVGAVLVTTDRLSDDVVYEFVKGVFENLDNFRTLHPVFATLEAEKMIQDAKGIAPVHPGAQRYFDERAAKAASVKPAN